MREKNIEMKFQELPEDLKLKVLEYIESLLNIHKKKKRNIKKFRFDWEGGLSEIGDQFTSVELQHQALLWR